MSPKVLYKGEWLSISLNVKTVEKISPKCKYMMIGDWAYPKIRNDDGQNMFPRKDNEYDG